MRFHKKLNGRGGEERRREKVHTDPVRDNLSRLQVRRSDIYTQREMFVLMATYHSEKQLARILGML